MAEPNVAVLASNRIVTCGGKKKLQVLYEQREISSLASHLSPVLWDDRWVLVEKGALWVGGQLVVHRRRGNGVYQDARTKPVQMITSYADA